MDHICCSHLTHSWWRYDCVTNSALAEWTPDLGRHSTPNGAISQPLIWSSSLPTKICCFCTKKCAWLQVRILSGWWFMPWRSVFPEQLWFLPMSYDHTLVHVHHIMAREVSWATSQEKVCSPGMSNDQEAYKHTHIHTHSHCELYDEL